MLCVVCGNLIVRPSWQAPTLCLVCLAGWRGEERLLLVSQSRRHQWMREQFRPLLTFAVEQSYAEEIEKLKMGIL